MSEDDLEQWIIAMEVADVSVVVVCTRHLNWVKAYLLEESGIDNTCVQ